MFDVIHGPAARRDAPGGFERAARERPPRLRVAVCDAFPAGTRGTLSEDVREALRGTADLLRSMGHAVVERDINFRVRDNPVILGLMFRAIRDFVQEVEQPQRLERRTRALAGALVSDGIVERLLEAECRSASASAGFSPSMTPVMSQPAVPAGIMEGRGATVTYLWETGWVPFTVLWNATGQPAVSVPAGLSPTGPPVAVQLIARANEEATLLSLAAQLEHERPRTDRHPPVSEGWAAGVRTRHAGSAPLFVASHVGFATCRAPVLGWSSRAAASLALRLRSPFGSSQRTRRSS